MAEDKHKKIMFLQLKLARVLFFSSLFLLLGCYYIGFSIFAYGRFTDVVMMFIFPIILSVSSFFTILKVQDNLRKFGYLLIIEPPFYGMNKILAFLFTKKFYERVILEVILDSEEEYFEALQGGRHWQAKWFKFLGYAYVFFAIVTEVFAAIKELLLGINKITK